MQAVYYASQQAEILRKIVPAAKQVQQKNLGVHEMQFNEETNNAVKMEVGDICIPGVELFTLLKTEELVRIAMPVFITVHLGGVLQFGDSLCRTGGGSAVIMIGQGVAWVVV